MASSFRVRLTHDPDAGAWFDQTRRYMLLRPEALMGIFQRQPEAERAIALQALQDSVFEQSSDSARAYRAMGGTGDALIGAIEASAPELGWGRWRFEREGDVLKLEVRNSPFAAGFGPSAAPVCAAITGMMRAVSTLVFGKPKQAREVQCAATGHDACRFEAKAAESGA